MLPFVHTDIGMEGLRMNRFAHLASLAAVLALGVLAMAVIRQVSAQTPVSGQPSPCTGMLPTVQAPASGAIPEPGGYAIPPTLLGSLDNAQSAYDSPILLPTDIPSDYQLDRILYSHTTPPVPQVDLLTICYRSSDGYYLQILEGFPMDPGGYVYHQTPDGEKGTTTVQGQEAYWTLGALLAAGPVAAQQLPAVVWQPGPLRLSWQTDIEVPGSAGAVIFRPGSDQPVPLSVYVGYQLESDSLNLDQLVSIANSVQPYQSMETGSSGAAGS